MNAECLVSVVIPCFNGAKYLADAVRSIQAQGIPDTEILIVDDCSTDDSIAAAEAQSRQFPGIRLIQHSKNAGQAAARNIGLRQARGRYLCFLDVDDEYAPGFFSGVLPLFQADSELAGVKTGVELVNCRHDVHPLQMQALITSLATNLMVRKAVADLLGGCPEDRAFRGNAGKEDIVFTNALYTWFKVVQCAAKFYRYRIWPGNHFEYFLDRSKVVDGQLIFTSESPEEESGELATAGELYLERIRQRIGAVASLRDLAEVFPPLSQRLFQSVATYDTLRDSLQTVEGWLHPQEGFALFHWAKEGPGQGAIVEVGSHLGRSTCWLASGSRSAGREKVVAVDHFLGSPEMQKNASHEVAAVVETGTTLPTFEANLQRFGLRERVEIRVGNSVEVGLTWQGPIRLLFIDGDHSHEASWQDIKTWGKYVVPGGVIAFHDVDVWPGVTKAYQEFLALNPAWKEIGRVHSLRIVQRRA